MSFLFLFFFFFVTLYVFLYIFLRFRYVLIFYIVCGCCCIHYFVCCQTIRMNRFEASGLVLTSNPDREERKWDRKSESKRQRENGQHSNKFLQNCNYHWFYSPAFVRSLYLYLSLCTYFVLVQLAYYIVVVFFGVWQSYANLLLLSFILYSF